jgi:acetone carboxylase gamma subunit
MCGETMRLSVRELSHQRPGQPNPTVQRIREWICPECDYFEEADAGED